MSGAPCKDCEDRELGCHAHCIAYRKYKDEREKAINKRVSATKADETFFDLQHIRKKRRATNGI